MANREAKIKFTADTKDLNTKIKNANSVMAEQRTELKLNEAQFKNTGNEAEYLKNKQQILANQLAVSQDKVKALSDKLEIAKQIFGENSNEVIAYQRQLVGAMTEEERLKTSISQCNTELKQHAEASEKVETATEQLTNKISQQETELAQLKGEYTEAVLKFGTASKEAKQLEEQIEDLSSELKTNKSTLEMAEKAADDLEDSFDKVDKSGGKVKETLSKVGGTVGKTAAVGIAAVSAAAIGAGKALTDMTTAGAEYADNVLTESTVTGIATDKLQEYQYAAELVDVSTETLTKSMAKNINSMKSAQKGSESYVEAYKKLGVSATDANGNLRDSETVYWELIDSLGKVENETERDALAMTVLGKSAQELNPLIEAGSEKMNELGQQAHDAGYVVSDETLNAYGELDNQLQKLNVGADAAKNALGTVLLPVLTEVSTGGVDLLGNFTNSVLAANGDMGKIGDAIGTLVTDGINKILEFLPQILSMATTLITSLASAISTALPEVVNGIIGCLPAVIQAFVALVNGVIATFPSIVSAIVQILPVLISGVQQLITSLIGTLPTIIQALVDALPTLIPALIDAVVNIIVTICEQFSSIIQPLIAALPDIIISIVTALMDNLPVLIQGLITLILSLVESIPTIIQALVDALPTVISSIISGLLSCIPQLITGLIQVVIGIVVALPQILGSLIEGIINIFVGIWDGLAEVFGGIGTWFNDNFGSAVDGIKNAFSGIGDFFGGVWDSIVNVFSGAVGFFKGIFEGVWNGIKWVINNIFIGGIEGLINIIIDGINRLLGLVNGTVSGLGSLIGQDWDIGLHINKVSLPRLYTGGIAFGLTPALVGDYPNAATNPEVIAPLNKLNSMISDNIESAINNNANHSAIDYDLLAEKMAYAVAHLNIEMKLDKRTLGRVVRGVT